MFNFKFDATSNVERTFVEQEGPLTEFEKATYLQVRSVMLSHQENRADRLSRYLKDMDLTDGDIESLADSLKSLLPEIIHPEKRGLDAVAGTPLPEEPTDVSAFTVGFGGSALRIGFMEVQDGKDVQTRSDKFDLCAEMNMRAYTATGVFDFIIEKIRGLIEASGFNASKTNPANVLITSTHPLCGNTIKFMKCKWFEDMSQEDPIVDVDLKQLFDHSARRAGVHAKCVGVYSDGVVAAASTNRFGDNPAAFLSVCTGSGLDMAYIHQNERLEHDIYQLDVETCKGVFFRTIVDQIHDFSYGFTRGSRFFERLVGGHAIANVARICFHKVMQDRAPAMAFKSDTLKANHVFEVINDRSSSLIVSQKVFQKAFHCDTPDAESLQAFSLICKQVVKRASQILAAVILGVAGAAGRCHDGYGINTVIFTGLLVEGNRSFIEHIQNYVERCGTSLGKIKLEYRKNAGTVGSALIVGHNQ